MIDTAYLDDLYEYLESNGFNTEVLRLFVYDLDEMNEYFNLNKSILSIILEK